MAFLYKVKGFYTNIRNNYNLFETGDNTQETLFKPGLTDPAYCHGIERKAPQGQSGGV